MNKKTMQWTMVVAQLAVATVAGAATVKYDMDGSVDFAKFQKVAFDSEASKGADAIADKRVRAAIRAELESKGYAMVEAGEADLMIDYFAVVRQRRELRDTSGPRLGRTLQMRQHPEGTLVVSFHQRSNGEVIWHGAVTEAIASSPEKADKKTEKAVGQLLEKFPSRRNAT